MRINHYFPEVSLQTAVQRLYYLLSMYLMPLCVLNDSLVIVASIASSTNACINLTF